MDARNKSTPGSRTDRRWSRNSKASLGRQRQNLDWNFEVWSNTHSMRPGGAGSIAGGQHMAQGFAVPAPKPHSVAGRRRRPQRRSRFYTFPNAHVVHHFIPAMPVRVSAMRALGAYHNVFSIESFIDELASRGQRRSGRIQGLKHLDDPRARDVIDKRRPQRSAGGRGKKRSPDRGFGFAFARYRISRPIAPSPARWR